MLSLQQTEEMNSGANDTQKAILMQLGRNQTKPARYTETWSLQTFAATGMKIKSKRLVTSETGEIIHKERDEGRSRKRTWLER